MSSNTSVYETNGEAQTLAFGHALAGYLRPGDIVLLRGELGAGKSVLARGIGHALGVTGPITSPSFTTMQAYQGTVPFYHFDLYRLGSIDELFDTGLNEYLGTDGVAVVEWPEAVDLDPENAMDIEIVKLDDERRRISVTDNRGGQRTSVAIELPKEQP